MVGVHLFELIDFHLAPVVADLTERAVGDAALLGSGALVAIGRLAPTPARVKP
jgi:hypothetical protein